MSFSLEKKKIWVAGSNGMVGRALIRNLENLDVEILTSSSKELDLRDQAKTRAWVKDRKPDGIIVAAAKVGGIWANNIYPTSFLYDNLMIEANVIEAAASIGVEKLLLLGTGCIYPKEAANPVKESVILSGPLEKTNEWYAVAKIAGIKLCQAYKIEHGLNFISAMPTNLYGPYDNFDPETSHVLPALMRKIHLAKVNDEKTAPIWGTGEPYRELMHVDDCADALVYIMQNYNELEQINVGTDKDMKISEIAEMVADVIDWQGEFVYDHSKPDGTMRKKLDITKLNALGWKPSIQPKEGIASVYKWFLENETAILEKSRV